MENHQYDIQVDKPDEWINLWFIGDQHIGSVACDEEKMDEDIGRIIRSRKPVVFNMGDWLDAICHRDKRFDPANVDPRFFAHLGDIFRWQLKDVKERMARLYPYSVGCHMGNHEYTVSKYFQYNPHAELLETFPKLKNLQNSSLTKIRVFLKKKYLYDFVVSSAHKVGEIKTMLAYMNRVKHFAGDIKVMGHNHKLEIKEVPELGHRDGGTADVRADGRFFGFTGSYLKTYASGQIGYGDLAGYEPVPLGCLNLRVRRNIDKGYMLERKS